VATSKSQKSRRVSPVVSALDGPEPFGHRPLRVALYARVSTAQQQTIPLQLEHLHEYAARRGWRVGLVRSEAKSGAELGRTARADVMLAARRREIDAVLVWKLDRWGRSLPDLVGTLHELAELGVAFVSTTEGFDLTTPAGRALAGMLSVFAAFEREIRRERQAAGIARARREGRHLGRPRKIWHRERSKVGELASKGLSPAAIARAVGIGRTSVRRILEGKKEK
jgi:DNA invertase Pin-like site-specific DNA recombinase